MHIFKAHRIFMNEADSSPGNGALAEPAAPAESAAVPTTPVFDADALVARLVGVMDQKLAAHQNATNAALRKAGVFKQEKPAESNVEPTPIAPTAAQSGISLSDVEALLERKGVVSSRAAKHGLSEAAARRFETAMAGVARESLAAEADAYLSDLGLVKAAQSPAPSAPAPAPAQPKPNISDRGAAAPTDLRDSEGVLNSRPLEMTGHDVDSLTLKYGHDKGLQMFQERVLHALAGVRIKPPRG